MNLNNQTILPPKKTKKMQKIKVGVVGTGFI
jgi:hypothetical protein